MSRRDIYYWKCDRPAAFHGTQARSSTSADIAGLLRDELRRHFSTLDVLLSPGVGQGNHLTWNAEIADKSLFIRVENGPEQDAHLAVESALLDRVRDTGVITPRVFGFDATRTRVPFAWQALERIPAPDLNHWFKQGTLDSPRIAFAIGEAIAKWQYLTFEGFGILEWSAQPPVRNEGQATNDTTSTLRSPHPRYSDYFHLRLEEHLSFLVSRGFLTATQRHEIATEIENHRTLLDLAPGCLVHKDLALWNILGTEHQISAFIDFDDSISGDPMDDLSLLACFHDAAFLQHAFAGYASQRPLPPEHLRRFWLHLLRNMIVKSVIRVGAGYFDRDDGFFLIGSGSSGQSLKSMTLSRLATALRGLREGGSLDILSP